MLDDWRISDPHMDRWIMMHKLRVRLAMKTVTIAEHRHVAARFSSHVQKVESVLR